MSIYQNNKVEKEKLDLILEAAHVAATGANRQPHRLIVVQSEEDLNKISKADGKRLTDIDVSIITDHMMLQTTELKLGTV